MLDRPTHAAAAASTAGAGETYAFAGFLLDPVRRMLSRDGRAVPLTARLFDILVHLVEHHDRFVEREELQAAIWLGRQIEEGTIPRAISALRMVLRDHGAPEGLIATAPTRGYRLCAPVVMTHAATAGVSAAPARQTGWRTPTLLAVAVLAAAGGAFWVSGAWRARVPPFNPPPHSLSVLPFTAPDGDATESNLADGLAEELITSLGRVEQLRVTSPRSSFMFREPSASIGEIARRLNVGAVLEGSVRRLAGRLHVGVNLTDTVSGYQIWSASYERDAGDVLAIQNDIASQVMNTLHVRMPADETPLSGTGGTSNSNAWDAYFAGTALLSKGAPADVAHALAMFSQAIAMDPQFERAYEFRSKAREVIAVGGDAPEVATQQRLLAAAISDGETAVALAPESGSAHGALGWALFVSGRELRRAVSEFTLARRLSPGDAVLHAEAALVMLHVGDTSEALKDARMGVELDPLSPDALRGAAWVYARARRADDLHAVLRQLRALPNGDNARLTQDECLSALLVGEYASTVALCQPVHSWIRPYVLAIAQWKLGRQADARAALHELQAALGDNAAFQYAEIYAVWGDRQASAHWLGVAIKLQDSALADVLVDDFLAPVRDTPEFDAAMHFVGLR